LKLWRGVGRGRGDSRVSRGKGSKVSRVRVGNVGRGDSRRREVRLDNRDKGASREAGSGLVVDSGVRVI
jgi:hypothetical protein